MASDNHATPPTTFNELYDATPQSTGDQRRARGEDDERPPPLPPRPVAPAEFRYERDDEQVMAYMIPLPRPNVDGRVLDNTPRRFMLYLPPAPDLLKPAPDSSGKSRERKRDKAHRKWQQEVRRATERRRDDKNNNGKVVSLEGLRTGSVRAAVWALTLLRRSDLTFLSRVPRRTVRSLVMVHPDDDIGREAMPPPQEIYSTVMGEFRSNRSRARRDFWIGAALLPVTTAVDLVIPVFGGLSEVNLVWMAINCNAWLAAKRVTKKMVLAPGVKSGEEEETGPGVAAASTQSQARGQERLEQVDGQEHQDGEKSAARQDGDKASRENEGDIVMAFRPTTSMDLMTRYLEAACHKQNPRVFPPVDPTPGEAEVLTSMGWHPEDREVEDKEADVAWQIRKTTDDLRVSTEKAAKRWDKWCKRYAKNPKAALSHEAKRVDDSDSD